MTNAGKYDVTEIRKKLCDFLSDRSWEEYTAICHDGRVVDETTAIIWEAEEIIRRRKRDAAYEREIDQLTAKYNSLTPEQRWEWVRYYLDQIYGIHALIICAGSHGSSERHDLDDAEKHLSVLAKLVGRWELRQFQEKNCHEKFKQSVGPDEYYQFMYGLAGTRALPANAVAYQMGRELHSYLLSLDTPAHIAYFELEEASKLVIWREEMQGTVLLYDGGFHASIYPKTNLTTHCGWEEPGFFDFLKAVLTTLCMVEVSLDMLLDNSEAE